MHDEHLRFRTAAQHIENPEESGLTHDLLGAYERHIAATLAQLSGLPAADLSSRLRRPADLKDGDLNVAVPSLVMDGVPATVEIAEQWIASWPAEDTVLPQLCVQDAAKGGTAFLQFFFKPWPLLPRVVTQILHQRDQYGSDRSQGLREVNEPAKGRKRIVIDFSSPNIAKPFHAGHLRSTVLGAVLANLYEAQGWEVVRMNYLGDWGKQFGLLAAAFERYGDEEKLLKDPIGHLFNIYVRINKEAGVKDAKQIANGSPDQTAKKTQARAPPGDASSSAGSILAQMVGNEQVSNPPEEEEFPGLLSNPPESSSTAIPEKKQYEVAPASTKAPVSSSRDSDTQGPELPEEAFPNLHSNSIDPSSATIPEAKQADEAPAYATSPASSPPDSDTRALAAAIHKQARRFFWRLETGNADAHALWHRFRMLSIKKYKQVYARLNIEFDEYSGESQVNPGRIEDVVDRLQSSGYCQEGDDGGLLVVVPEPDSARVLKAVIRKRDGTSLYLTRDIAAALQRHETYQFDRMLYVVGSQQNVHMQQVFRCLNLMGEEAVVSKCQHVSFGAVIGMSSRKGDITFLDDILNDAGDRCYEIMIRDKENSRQIERPKRVADGLGISAVAIQDLKSNRTQNYHFDLRKMTSFQGDTGPYLQYTHARLCSIFLMAGVDSQERLLSADLSLLPERIAIDLARLLVLWPSVVRAAMERHEPSTVVTYLFRLAHLVNAGYYRLWVMGQNPEVKYARMALYAAARQVLANGLGLLGLKAVERM